jgi:3',5'-cyclic AMP phosphodiesterase CpdA
VEWSRISGAPRAIQSAFAVKPIVRALHRIWDTKSIMFTLAHLSDPHLSPLPRPRRRELVGKRVTGYFNWQRKRRLVHDPAVLRRVIGDLKATATEHIAITGDFVNLALPEEFENLRKWLPGLGPQYDLTVIPGNHDIYVPGALDMMQDACADSMRGDDEGATFPFVRRRGQVALIALNTGVPTPPLIATGRLGENQLARLARVLPAVKNEGLFRVVLIHHPPESAAPRYKRLTDAPAFRSVIAEHGAELILHGHDHIHQLHWLTGPSGHVPAVGVPSASAAPGRAAEPGGYNLYRIDGEPGAWRCEMEMRSIDGGGKVGSIKRTMLLA